MNNFVYQYSSPLDRGYTQVSIHIRALRAAGVRPRHRFGCGYMACYHHPIEGLHVEHLTRLWAKGLAGLLLPLTLLLTGIFNWRETCNDYQRLLFEHKTGSFTTDHIFSSNEGYIDLMASLKNNT